MMLGKWCSLMYVDKEIDHLCKTCYIYCWLYSLDGRESLFFGTSSPSWCNVFFYLIKVFMLSIKKKKKKKFIRLLHYCYNLFIFKPKIKPAQPCLFLSLYLWVATFLDLVVFLTSKREDFSDLIMVSVFFFHETLTILR